MLRYVNLFFKRIVDILGSLLGIILLSPFFIIISIAIKIDSKGPVLFRQERLGKDGKVFKILKFRTMIVNAEKIGDGLTVKSNTDSRITKMGKVLRKTSLDEIPQLINVLFGTMSFVGPRPPVTYFPYNGYSNYPIWMKRRFDMKPGITGLAQIVYRNTTGWDQRIFLDVKYIEKFNIIKDIKILILTVYKLFQKEQIYGETDKSNWTQPPLKFDKGYLNRLEKDYFKYYYKWRNDKDVFKYLGGGYKEVSKNNMKLIFSKMLKDKKDIRYTILDNTFKPIGMIGLYNYSKDLKTAEVGMYIGDKSKHSKGYGKTAYQRFEKEIIENFDIDELVINVVEKNKQAVSFWESNGFKFNEFNKHKRVIDNDEYDVLKMSKRVL